MNARSPHILLTTDAVGGVWRYSLDLASGLAESGWRVSLLCLGPRPAATEYLHLQNKGIAFDAIDLPLDWLAVSMDEVRAAADAVARYARELRVDSVHLHSPAYAVARDYAVPVVAVSHSCLASWWQSVRTGELPDDFRWRTDLHGEGIASADRLICPSHSFARMTTALYQPRRAPIVIWNGRRRVTARVDAPVHGDVFTIGRLWDEGKNIATLDRAARHIGKPLFAAGGSTAPDGHTVAFRHLRCLGYQPEEAISAVLAQQPIFVSAARYEPFGLGVLEAAQQGCPLVLSDIPTFRELWEGAAIFVDPNDDQSMAAVINDLLQNGDKRAECGERAREKAARYSAEAMVAHVAHIHAGLLQDNRLAVGATA